MEGLETVGGDIQGNDKDGSNSAGHWDAVKSCDIDCATIW